MPGSAQRNHTDLLIRIHPWDEARQCYPVEAWMNSTVHFADGEMHLDHNALQATENDVTAYGLALFDALFSGTIRRAYDRAIGIAEARTNDQLRLRLWIDPRAPELHALLWERLQTLRQNTAFPLAATIETPFSRYTGLEIASPEPIGTRPIRMLVAVANPTDLINQGMTPIDVDHEIDALTSALESLQRTGQLHVTLLPGRTGLNTDIRTRLEQAGYVVHDGPTTLDTLIRELATAPGYHILHFLGHGAVSRAQETSTLFLEDANGFADACRDTEIVAQLGAINPPPHLIFLAACDSAKRDPQNANPYVGLAPKLVQAGIPAIIAMRDTIASLIARELSLDFYRDLLEHGSVDMLVAVANPTDLINQGMTPIDVDHEIDALTSAVDNLRRTGQLHVTLLPGRTGLNADLRARLEQAGYVVRDGPTTLDTLIRELATAPGCHILHFLGHGVFSRAQETTTLLLEDANGFIDARRDAEVVAQFGAINLPPHLIILTSCDSTKRDPENANPYVRLAPQLAQAGIPAIIAMQDSIAPLIARELSRDFYRGLLEHGCVDRALNHARLLLLENDPLAWAIPALLMRLDNGQLFTADPVISALQALLRSDVLNPLWQGGAYLPLEVRHFSETLHNVDFDALVQENTPGRGLIETVLDIFAPAKTEQESNAPSTIALIGDAGMGQSTEMRHIAQITAQQSLQTDAPRLVIPVYADLQTMPQGVRVNEWILETLILQALEPFWEEDAEQRPADVLRAYSGPTLRILFDGSEVLPYNSRRRFCTALQDFIRRHSRHEYIVSFNTDDFDVALFQASDTLIMLPLSKRNIQHYLTQDLQEPAAKQLYYSLEKTQLFDLAAVPWLLFKMLKQTQAGIPLQSRMQVLGDIVDDQILEIAVDRGMRTKATETLYMLAWEMQSTLRYSLSTDEAFDIMGQVRGPRGYDLETLYQELSKNGLLQPIGGESVCFSRDLLRTYCFAQAIMKIENQGKQLDATAAMQLSEQASKATKKVLRSGENLVSKAEIYRQLASTFDQAGAHKTAERLREKAPKIPSQPITPENGNSVVDVEIRIFSRRDTGYSVEIKLDDGRTFNGNLSADIVSWTSSGDMVADGRHLFGTLFADPLLHSAWAVAGAMARQRRIHLWIDQDTPELHTLPWELLHDGDVMLSACADTPFSRYLPSDAPLGSPVIKRPLRILAVIPNPNDLGMYGIAPLDVSAERHNLEAIFSGLPAAHLHLDFLEAPVSPKRLEAVLREQRPHILHLIAHNAFNQKRDQAALYLQDDTGNSFLISDTEFSSIFHRLGQECPRLVFLAACESAARSTVDAFTGLAPKLVQVGVPAVVAMQDRIAITTTQALTSAFYTELFRHGEVDRALNEARSWLLTGQSPDVGVPVLFMRLPDGKLWETAQAVAPVRRDFYLHAPRLEVDRYVNRPHEYDQIKALLLADTATVGITTALCGVGGYGKTALARALCDDAEVQARFSDGILWATLGKTPDVLARLREWVTALGGVISDNAPTIPQLVNRLTDLLRDGAYLLLIDDVWESTTLTPFLCGGPRCGHLITTRNRATLPAGVQSVDVAAMRAAEAVTALSYGLDLAADMPEAASLLVLAQRLGHWPLLLGIINGVLREECAQGDSLADALAYVADGLDAEGLIAFDAADEADRARAVRVTLEMSLELLGADERARYNELAIFPENVNIPLATLETLWRATGDPGPVNVKELCGRFAELCLFVHLDPATQTIRLYDVMHAYLNFIQYERLPGLHNQLLDAYAKHCEEGWPTGPNDGYFFAHLTYHLINANRSDELRTLSLDFAWVQAKLNVATLEALRADYDYLADDVTLRMLRAILPNVADLLNKDNQTLARQVFDSISRLSPSSQSALLWAEALRQATGASVIYTEYLLIGLYQKPDGPTQRLLTLFDDHAILYPELETLANQTMKTSVHLNDIRPISTTDLDMLPLSANTEKALVEAAALANEKASPSIRSRHLLASFLAVPKSVAGNWVAGELKVRRELLHQLIVKTPDAAPPMNKIRRASDRNQPLSRDEALAHIKFIVGDLLEQQVSAVVNAVGTDPERAGNIGNQLAQRLGPTFYDNLQAQGPLALGEALITDTEGHLKSQYIIHPCVEETNGQHTLTSLTQGAVAALSKAEDLSNIKTIAFPSIGTGAANLNVEQVAPEVLSSIVNYLEQGCKLEQVYFVFDNEIDYQIYVATYQSLGGVIESHPEQQIHVRTYSWYLNLEMPPDSDLRIGEPFTIALRLTPNKQSDSKKQVRVPENIQELTIYIEAYGLQLAGPNRRHLKVDKGNVLERSLSLELLPLISGEQSVRILIYPGRQPTVSEPVELNCACSIPHLLVLPDIRELTYRQAIPDPQPDVILYVTLKEALEGRQEVVFYVTCPTLGQYQEPMENPHRLTKLDLVTLQQAAVRAAIDAANAPPSDVVAGLRAFGMLLFDQLMPADSALRELYWQICILPASDDTPWSWLVVSDEQAMLPWEMVCAYFFDQDHQLWHDDFMADKFLLAHWVGRKGFTLASEAPLAMLDLTHYDQRRYELPRWKVTFGGAERVKEDRSGHLALMQRNSPYYGLHVLRYTDRDQRDQITAWTETQAEANLGDAEAMLHNRRLDFTLRRPVVGLSLLAGTSMNDGGSVNDYDTQLEEGWMLPLMHAGASALVGPRWLVRPEVDQHFYRTFYEWMQAGMPLGWAVWYAREQVRRAFPHHPDWLAYAYFGHPRSQPYIVQPAEGFALFEAVGHEKDEPFYTEESYKFRASYRAEAPDWYAGRRYQGTLSRKKEENEKLSVLVMPLNGGPHEKCDLEPVPNGDSYQRIITLTMPGVATTLQMLVQFQKEDEELQTLVMNLDVIKKR